MENVVSIFKAKEETEEKDVVEQETVDNIFEEAVRRNEENRKRMEQKRLNDNKSVLKSYKIK